ncbi:MAG: hypothetical protein Q9M23_05545 [Mariprofundaceae bacterium]|nr:hypothetical protein [Mariprofundaceae bacterium]
MKRGMLIGFVLLLAACSPDVPEWTAPQQAWNDLAIRIETRPTVVRPGMNEFLVIANRKQRGFSSDLMVDVRTENSPWKQAMPDGALGIYRRALPVKDVQHDHLYVRLVRQGEQHEMIFELAPRAESEGQVSE